MHIPDGYLSPATAVVMYAASAPFWYRASQKLKTLIAGRLVPRIALFAALSFVIMMFNIPAPGGTSAHSIGAVLAALVIGPWATVLAISVALVIQAFFFGDGGILALGANAFRPFQDGSEEERMGWADWRNPLIVPPERDFLMQERFALFALRIDTRRVPPLLLPVTARQVSPAADRARPPGGLPVVLRGAQQHRVGVADVIPQTVAAQTLEGRTALHDIVHNLPGPGGITHLFRFGRRFGRWFPRPGRAHARAAHARVLPGGSHSSRVRSGPASRPEANGCCYPAETPVTPPVPSAVVPR